MYGFNIEDQEFAHHLDENLALYSVSYNDSGYLYKELREMSTIQIQAEEMILCIKELTALTTKNK